MFAGPNVVLDSARGTAIIGDAAHALELRLNFARGCEVSGLRVNGKAVDLRFAGTGVQVGGHRVTSAVLAQRPKVRRDGDRLRVTEIEYEAGGIRVAEGWTFTARRDSVLWRIDRRYLDAGTLDATAMPSFAFGSMATWTGALLGTGGVAWGKLLDAPNATYGVHTDAATLWNPATDACLRLAAVASTGRAPARAMSFTRESDGRFSVAATATREPLRPRYDKARFVRDRQDVWKEFAVRAGESVTATYELRASSYREAFGRGDFKGLDTPAVTELLNTIGRIGVIDDDLVGSNGWYSGYICMHEPWLARVGTAIDDPNYTASCARFLDLAREHAVKPDGMVLSRWKYDAGDARPGTYDEAIGFYEAQWGRLMDSQSSYVTNVADQFDASGDRAWVARQKSACESALDYLLRRDADGDGLVEMENSLTSQRRSSDWLDIVWASHENAFVNAQLYGALLKWTVVERVLGDETTAKRYEAFAAKLKASFNRPIAEGGFWDPAKGWYVYWRDADGSIHGNNLVIPVNLTAIGEGLCDDPARREALLATIESRMNAESPLAWPACFEGYAPGEGADDVFPKYENGDIFLAWAEYGVRAYAATEPSIALKYVRRIVDRYKADGLAFQRYLRNDGRGAGDDILANNANVMTGLYRDIYGIRPKFDRLEIDPHLVPELDGTRVEYNFRGRRLRIDLAAEKSTVRDGELAASSSRSFGVDFRKGGVAYFEGGRGPEVEAEGSGATIDFSDWSGARRIGITSGAKAARLRLTFPSRREGETVRVWFGGRPIATLDSRTASCPVTIPANAAIELRLAPASPNGSLESR